MTSWQKKRFAALAIVTFVIVPVVGYGFAANGAAPKAVEVDLNSVRDNPLPVETFVLGEIKPPSQLDWYRGLVVPSKEADLGFRRGGRIDQIHVEEGDRVQRGAVLATLDSSDVRSQLLATKSQIREAEALLAELVAGPRAQTIGAARSEVERLAAIAALSRVTADRMKKLLQSNASSVQQFDEASYSVEQSDAARGLWSVCALVDVDRGVGMIERRDVQVIETDTEVAKIVGSMANRARASGPFASDTRDRDRRSLFGSRRRSLGEDQSAAYGSDRPVCKRHCHAACFV